MVERLIEQLLIYAQAHLGLRGFDVYYARNLLMAEFKVAEPYKGELSQEEKERIRGMAVPDEFIESLCSIASERELAPEGMELSFASKIMGLLTPSPEKVIENFDAIMEREGIESACLYLYELSIKNNYIQKTAIGKNIKWRADFGENFIEVTINLSKPEKDNREILRQLKQQATSYPSCALCIDNLGFEGNLYRPPRQNIRVIPVKLAGEEWFVQYSPYLYYDEHCIAISMEHRPMKVDSKTFLRLLDFVDIFPHYFIGSNASLPIVGGSILSHEHYQGGGYKMPLHYAADKKFYDCKMEGVSVSTVSWYNRVVRIRSADRQKLYSVACKVLEKWLAYTNEECEIISRTAEQHNALTPIMRREKGEYVLEIILRNNRTSEKHPDGIFHAHAEYHNIKKEGIGLIEAMGLYILPGRLKRQTEEIKRILCGEREYGEDLEIHKGMIERLLAENETPMREEEARRAITEYINEVCRLILINTAVFKPDEKGQKAFDEFMSGIF